MKRFRFRKGLNKAQRSKIWASNLTRSLVFAMGLVSFLCVLGVVGFILIEGWNLREALYMTVITISTVGFSEVRPLSPMGQLFSSALIIVGVCVTAYCFGIVGRVLLEGEIHHFRRIHKMNKIIAGMKDHFIVCGYGRLANFIIPDLKERGEKLVVVENNPAIIEQLTALNIPFVEGNAYDEDTLALAGIDRAQALLALLTKDPDNVYVTLVARHLNKKIRIVARTESEESENKLRIAGANQVISPYRVSGSRIVQQLLNPNVNDFLQIIADEHKGERLVLEQTVVPDGSSLVGKTLHEANLPKQTGVTIAAYVDPSGKPHLTPQADDVIRAGTMMIVFGTDKALEKLSGLLQA